MSNIKRTFLLLCLFAASGWLAYAVHSSPDRQNTAQSNFISINEIQSTDIQIRQHTKNQTLHFQKQNATWQLIQPIRSRIKPEALQALFDVFQFGAIERIGPQKNMEQFGFDPPALTVTAWARKDPSNYSMSLEIGSNTPDDTACYARTGADSSVYVIGLLYKKQLLQPPSFYR